MKFTLAVPRENVVFTFAGPLQQLQGREDLYAPIADALADRIVPFDELAALDAFDGKLSILLECLGLLVHSGQAVALLPPEPDTEPAKRFNRMVVEQARAGRSTTPSLRPWREQASASASSVCLPSPADGGHDGAREDLRRRPVEGQGIGRVVVKDGEAVQDDDAAPRR